MEHGRMWHRLIFVITCALAMMTMIFHIVPARAASLPTIVYTQATCTLLQSKPLASAAPLSDVMGGTGLRVTGTNSTGAWYKVIFLGSITAWVPINQVGTSPPAQPEVSGDCQFPGVRDTFADPITSAPGPYDMQASGTITQPTALRSSPSPAARVTAQVAPGQRAFVTQWGGDNHGDIWYLTHVQGQVGWLWAYALRFDDPDPATHEVNGKPLWSLAAGKGMWFVNYFPRHTDMGALIAAAKAAGITHLYPEVAISTDGFYGKVTLDRLLPAAHKAGITVIAWVYPYLRNVAADLALTKAVVDYRTPSGDKVDGISADIEERTDAPAVYAYGQVLRQMVGPDTILVVTPYNPQARPNYPYPEVAASFNVIAPQDYWHNNTHTTFSNNNPRALLLLTVTAIRAELGGKFFPIEELGQTYDMFSDDFSPSGTEPSGDEIRADMQAAKEYGCIGVSYFEWQTASPDELDAFDSFQW